MQTKQRPVPPRPWYREPWPWVLIAIPLLTIVASGITLWLALSRPDHSVVDAEQYREIKSGLRAQTPATPTSEPEPPRDDG